MQRVSSAPFLMYGVLLVCVAMVMYLIGVLMVAPRYLLGLEAMLRPVSEWLVWYSGVPLVVGILLSFLDLFVLLSGKRTRRQHRYSPLRDQRVTVALTAYNDEASISPAVYDFLDHPLVERVIVVSNNSSDRTIERAIAAGAIAVNEASPGYGSCVHRCFSEALRYEDTELIVLCEGDRTFRAYDIDKLLAYAPHADIVNGTRTVEPLRQYQTQLSTFMYYGNLFVGKLLEAKRLGRCTFTDVGSTYKLCRRVELERLLPHLNPSVNLEFNAYFMDTALAHGLTIVECPITFHPRIGISKGGNANNARAFTVGARMILGILFGWRLIGA
jgi:glycosyltransferase involved in cell wall biosynthesis